MKVGIIGLPNVGKSALFNALTGLSVDSQNYPFCTVEPNISIVPVPDTRLDILAKNYKPDKITYATIEFVDIAGLVKGASRGEGLGNKFLSNIREVDAILHVVRCFENDEIVNVNGDVNPARDIEIIDLELILSDIETIERRINKISKLLKGNKKYEFELIFLKKLLKNLENGISSRNIEVNESEKEYFRDLSLLTKKPVIYLFNVNEDEIGSCSRNKFLEQAQKDEKLPFVEICVDFELQLSKLEENDKFDFIRDLGLKDCVLGKLIKVCYDTLGLISFFTAGEQEVKAWTIRKGTKAPEAAGKIHSDIEKGFIRAEVVSFENLSKLGSISCAKERGLVSSEGKEYEIRDGDVVLFRFNV
ncbi:MAG: redox-regulated ATPase YchF [Firmicutes bacterium]|nr:redox-regulated ATPase YchF [Bacillota bacterium]